MITLFTVPKPFLGNIGMIQRNAIQSWTRLHPDIDILMFGNEQGAAEVAAEFGIRHFPDVDVNEYGTPRMSGSFQQAEEAGRHSRIFYVNADIILFPDLLEAVTKVDLPKFVMGGLRTDYDILKPVDFTRHDWAEALREDAKTNGTLHGFGGIDYFVYPRGLFGEIPPFALGRWYWDQWLVYRARRLGGALIDATACVMARSTVVALSSCRMPSTPSSNWVRRSRRRMATTSSCSPAPSFPAPLGMACCPSWRPPPPSSAARTSAFVTARSSSPSVASSPTSSVPTSILSANSTTAPGLFWKK